MSPEFSYNIDVSGICEIPRHHAKRLLSITRSILSQNAPTQYSSNINRSVSDLKHTRHDTRNSTKSAQVLNNPCSDIKVLKSLRVLKNHSKCSKCSTAPKALNSKIAKMLSYNTPPLVCKSQRDKQTHSVKQAFRLYKSLS